MMRSIILILVLIAGAAQFSFGQDTIGLAYGQDYLVFNEGGGQFFSVKGEPITPLFKTPPCYYPLNIDANVCYLEANEPFEAQVDGKYGLITRSGDVLLPFEYDEILTNYNGRVFVCEGKKWFEIDWVEGSTEKDFNKIPLDCDFVANSYRVGIILIKDKQVFFSSEKGQITTKSPKETDYGYFTINHGCSSGAGTDDGRVILPVIYRHVKPSSEGIFMSDGDKWGYYNVQKEQMTAVKYDNMDAGSHNDGLLTYSVGNKEGLMNVSGKILTEPIYQNIYDFGDSIIQVEANDQWGFIGSNGKEIVPCIYEDVDSFKNGLAAAKKNGKWGFINIQGEVEIPFQFQGGPMGLYFRTYEKAKIKEGQTCFFINRKGEKLEECSCR